MDEGELLGRVEIPFAIHLTPIWKSDRGHASVTAYTEISKPALACVPPTVEIGVSASDLTTEPVEYGLDDRIARRLHRLLRGLKHFIGCKPMNVFLVIPVSLN